MVRYKNSPENLPRAIAEIGELYNPFASSMIILLIFYFHVVAAVYAFTKRWQDEGKNEAFLTVGFMALVFVVGWSVATFILKLFVEEEGLGTWFDRDAMSLALLTLLEAVLYSMYFKRKKQKTPPTKM